MREARRAYGKATAIPEDVAAAKAALESEGYAAWVAARAASSFSDFAPTLERVVALERGIAARLAPVVAAAAGRADVAEPYDALLDAYERGAPRPAWRPSLPASRRGWSPCWPRCGRRAPRPTQPS